VLAVGDGQGRVEIIVQPPDHVVAVQMILLDTNRGGFVRIVAQTLSVDLDLIEPAAVALPGLNRQRAGQQTDAVGIVHRAAVHIEIAAGGGEAITELERLHDVVIFEIVAAG